MSARVFGRRRSHMPKSEDKRHEETNKLFDDLLGPLESWSALEVDQFLADAGVDVDAASKALFERVSDIAATYRRKNQDVPAPVGELLKPDTSPGRRSQQRGPTRLRMKSIVPTCASGKFCYETIETAALTAERMMEIGDVDAGCHVEPYPCRQCHRFHVGNRKIVFTEEDE